MSDNQPNTEFPPHRSPPPGGFPPLAEPGLPPVPPPQATVPFVPKGFAITGMVVGIVGVVMFFVPFWGPIVSLIGLIFGIVATVKKQPRGLSLTGIITGSVGIVIGLALWIWIFVWAAQTVQEVAIDPAVQQQIEEQLEREAEQFE